MQKLIFLSVPLLTALMSFSQAKSPSVFKAQHRTNNAAAELQLYPDSIAVLVPNGELRIRSLPQAPSGLQLLAYDPATGKVYRQPNAPGASGYGSLNAEDYGVLPANNAAANTAAVNSFLALCESQNKTAVFGSGTFWFDGTVFLPPHVDLIGSGANRTVFKSATATTLLKTLEGFNGLSDVPQVRRHVLIKGIQFDGNNAGTTGLHLYKVSNFYLQDCMFTGFTQKNTYIEASIYGSINDCRWWGGTVGVASDNGNGIMGNNTIKFYNCEWTECGSWAVDWNGGAQVNFTGCTMERCGTNGNASTGAIRATHISPNDEGVGLVLQNCWLEANAGTVIDLVGTGSNVRYVIANSLIQFDGFGRTASMGIRITSGTGYQRLSLENATVQVNGPDLYINGSKAIVTMKDCLVDSYSKINGGLLYRYDPVAVQ